MGTICSFHGLIAIADLLLKIFFEYPLKAVHFLDEINAPLIWSYIPMVY
jgi:hypothetical protein